MRTDKAGALAKRKGGCNAGSWLFPVICCVIALCAGEALGDEAQVWRYDFREIFYDIAILNKDKAVIVGDRGRVLVTHGKFKNLWSPRDSGTGELLTSISFADERTGWAAGHAGVIIHTSDGGESWELQRAASSENQPLFDIQCISENVAFACGAYDTVLKTIDGGAHWEMIPTGLDKIYNGLCFINEATGYLVGEESTVVRTQDGGRRWEELDLGGRQGAFFGITRVSDKELLVYGIAGRLMRSGDDGRTWEAIPLGINQSLYRAAVNGKEVALVGGSGTILVSKDGVRSFVEMKDEDLTTFAGVCAHPEGGFICVGERGKIHRINSSDKQQ